MKTKKVGAGCWISLLQRSEGTKIGMGCECSHVHPVEPWMVQSVHGGGERPGLPHCHRYQSYPWAPVVGQQWLGLQLLQRRVQIPSHHVLHPREEYLGVLQDICNKNDT